MPDKERERFYLAALRNAFPTFPSGNVLSAETPDFLVVSAMSTIGLEFTEFHLPPPAGEQPHQETQALKERIVARAAELHEQADGAALYVSVFFQPRTTLNKHTVEGMARKVANAVSATPIDSTDPLCDVTVSWRALPPGISNISIRLSIDGIDRLWHADAGGWVAPISPDHIRAVVARKTRMAAAARRRCDELWLVIVNDVFSRAAQASLSDETVDALFEHPFDRLLWLIPHAPRVVILKSSRAA